MSLIEKITFLSNHTTNTRCADVQDIVCSFIGNNWSDIFVIEKKFLQLNLKDFYIQGGGKLQLFFICSFDEISIKISSKLKSTPIDLNVINFIEYLNKIINTNTIVSIDIDHQNVEHCFVLFKESNSSDSDVQQLFIADSYINVRNLEIREFSINKFQDLLIDPNTKKYNELFKCEESDDFNYPIAITIHVYDSLTKCDNSFIDKYNTLIF